MYAISAKQFLVRIVLLLAVAFLLTQSCGAQESQPTPAQQAPVPQPQQSPIPSPQQAAQPGSVPQGAPTVHEESIAEIPSGSEYMAADILGGHLVWLEKAGDGYTVRLDGKQVGGTYQEVHSFSLRGKADAPHVLMVAKRQGKWVALYDGEERTPEYDKMTAADAGPDGHPLIVGGCRAKKCYLIVDGKETGPAFDEVAVPDFYAKSGRYAYFGRRDKKWVAMLDGKQTGPEMDDFLRSSWDMEGKFLAVAARLEKKYTWIVDGKPGPLFDVIGEIAFSPDGRHYAYGGARVKSGFGSKEVRGSIVTDGRESEESWKGKGLKGGWTMMLGSYEYVLKGVKRLSPDFHGVSDPEFTSDGSLVFAQRQGDGSTVVHFGGRAGPSFDDVVSPIIISEDGKHVAYVARQGNDFVPVHDQVAAAGLRTKRPVGLVGWIMMSKDGSHMTFETVFGGEQFQQGKTRRALRRVVIDGVGGKEYDAYNLVPGVFDEAGKRYSYIVHGAQGDRDRMVFDEVEGPLYDDILSQSAHLVDEQTIEFIARQGHRFLRVTMKLG